MSSVFGKNIKIEIFGGSHSAEIGVNIDGLPSGERIDTAELARFLSRRAPGRNEFSTPRKEKDEVKFISGVDNGVISGETVRAIIENTNVRSGDYKNLLDIPRPGHADFTAFVKYGGKMDMRGGGHFSGRLTAPLCIAGGICSQILARKGIFIGAHIYEIAGVSDTPFDPVNISPKEFESIAAKDFPALDDSAAEQMKEKILDARAEGDSVGGIVECAVLGLPVGIGEPMADGLENKIAAVAFGIPAVKGIEFGVGFACAKMRGSQNNDPFYYDGDSIKTRSNNHGGILGGISSGMPLIFRCAVKPTPSIAREQDSVSLSRKENAKLQIVGRHDPCIVQRSVPVFEAAAAIAIYDAMLENND